jgi:hypothetical protein
MDDKRDHSKQQNKMKEGSSDVEHQKTGGPQKHQSEREYQEDSKSHFFSPADDSALRR